MGINFDKLLNMHQYEACCSSSQHLRIIAGAGTGKTRVLTYRIAYLISEVGINPNRIVAITFTNKVAKEMQDRVTRLMSENDMPLLTNRPWISTFHGFCYRFLRRECLALDGFNTKFTIADDEQQKAIYKQVFAEMHLDKDKETQKSIIGQIGNLKSKGIFAEDVTENMLPPFGQAKPSDIIRAYNLYQESLKKSDCMDFDDLLMFTSKILKEHDDIRERWQRKFDAYLVDEFQDTNYLQYELIQLLLDKEAMLTVVGDPDQTIYTWRGADSELIQYSLPKDYPDLETVTLDLNYRSTQKILDKANLLIKNNAGRLDKSLVAFNREDGRDVSYIPCTSNDLEAALVANKIVDLHREGVQFKDIVVIYRSNYLSQPFESKLTGNKIPYAVYGGLKFFDRAEVKTALAYMRLLVNIQDDYSFVRALGAPSRGIGATSYQMIKDYATERGIGTFEECLNHRDEIPLKPAMRKNLDEFMSVYEEYKEKLTFVETEGIKDVVEKYLMSIGFYGYVNDLDTKEDQKSFDINDKNTRMKNVRQLIVMLMEFLESDHFDEDGNHLDATLEEFLIDVALQSAQDEVGDSNKVLLMTAHVSKGLEFPYVFVVGLDEGIFPTNHALERGRKAIEEERRLCYVAMTRAKKQLFLSSQGGYSYISQSVNVPSQFLDEIGFHEKPKYAQRDEQRPWGGYGQSNKSKGRYAYDGVFGSSIKAKPVQSKPVINNTPTTVSSNYSDSKASSEIYSVGDKVAHISFGIGEVIEVGAKNIKVTFPEPYGTKVLMKGFKAFRKVS